MMGGFSLNLRGSGRDTHDIDLAIGCDMQRLISILKPQDRILRPLGPVSGVMRIFVRAGGSIDVGLPNLLVVVDLVFRGALGAPGNPQTASEVITSPPALGSRPYTVLNIAAIMNSKLGAYFARSSDKDFADIQFLLTRYPQEIWSIRAQLNQNHRQAFVNAFASTNPPQARLKGAKQILGIARSGPLVICVFTYVKDPDTGAFFCCSFLYSCSYFASMRRPFIFTLIFVVC
ncbi:hypothetical protein BKA65DRAFT_121040 [Rhexocercosporidium sp. MPI-PUGE-AT-0058]|nr:hypothetical protein BKA65DRAFT_121040 [Rhexocercosporidium sp. MPI-PUGE-AT-0058]